MDLTEIKFQYDGICQAADVFAQKTGVAVAALMEDIERRDFASAEVRVGIMAQGFMIVSQAFHIAHKAKDVLEEAGM